VDKTKESANGESNR